MTHERLVELTTTLHRGGSLRFGEALEFARCISKGNSELEAVTFRLVTLTSRPDDAAQFSVACKLMFGPLASEWV